MSFDRAHVIQQCAPSCTDLVTWQSRRMGKDQTLFDASLSHPASPSLTDLPKIQSFQKVLDNEVRFFSFPAPGSLLSC